MSIELLQQEIEAFEKGHVVVWNSWKNGAQEVSGKDALIDNLFNRYENLGGLWRDRNSGSRIDIQNAIATQIQLRERVKVGNYFEDRPYAKNRDLFGKYVSPFKPRNNETLARQSGEMKVFVKKHIEKENLIFISSAAESKVVDLISKNFLAQDSENGPIYHRVNPEGIVSPVGTSLNELLTNLGANNFIDEDRTSISRMIYDSNLRQQASQILGIPFQPEKENSKDATLIEKRNGADPNSKIKEMMSTLKRLDQIRVGKQLKIDANYIQSEFEKQATIEANLPSSGGNLRQINAIKAAVKFRFERLNSVDDLRKEINTIEIEQPKTWEI